MIANSLVFLCMNTVGVTEAAEQMTDGELVGIVVGVVVVLVAGVTAGTLLVLRFVDITFQ